MNETDPPLVASLDGTPRKKMKDAQKQREIDREMHRRSRERQKATAGSKPGAVVGTLGERCALCGSVFPEHECGAKE